MKHYTIKINKNNNNNTFRTNNASKNLDDLLLSNIIKMNPFLGYKSDDDTIKINFTKNDSSDIIDAALREAGLKGDDRIIISNRYDSYLKDDFDTEFAKAARFFSSYTPDNKKTYILADGTPIGFFEDEIQIGYDLIPLYKFGSPKYYNLFTPEKKKIIINLYISINR